MSHGACHARLFELGTKGLDGNGLPAYTIGMGPQTQYATFSCVQLPAYNWLGMGPKCALFGVPLPAAPLVFGQRVHLKCVPNPKM